MERQIIIDYYSSHSFEETAQYFKVGKKKLNMYFEQFNIPKRKKGGQNSLIKKYNESYRYDFYENQINETTRIKNVCKLTGKIFYDWFNEGGFLSTHLRSLNIDVPVYNDRNNYQMEYGLLWWEQHFDYIIENFDVVKCKLCDWVTTDLDNKSGSLEQHIVNNHNTTLENYLITFPDDKNHHKVLSEKLIEINHLSVDTNNVICKVCGKKLRAVSNTHLKTHGMTIMDYRVKYPNDKLISEEKYIQYKKQFAYGTTLIKNSFKSVNEVEVSDFLKSINIKVIQTYRKIDGMEIDIFLPDFNLGIEYNGLFWHSEEYGKTKMYHLNKTIKCSEHGVKLIHIFEDEWVNNREIVKKKLLHIIGMNTDIKIHARKCEIKEITPKDKNDFLNLNHIQGEDRSNYHLGAYFNNELVSVMCFNSNRNMTKNIKNQWELTRFANKYKICGIANRLLKNFIKFNNPSSIISFADRRWTLEYDDNLYTNLGFKLTSISEPNYSYFNPKIERTKRLHKFNFGKNKILKKHPDMDPTKSEWELMKELGYKKIWDCGLLKYELLIN